MTGCGSTPAGANPGGYRAAGGRELAYDAFRPIPALRIALGQGLAQVRGSSRVLERPCNVVRTGAPLGETIKKPTAAEYVDLCVDTTGVVLSQDWFLDHKQVEHMVAVAFEPGAAISSSDFAHDPSVAAPSQILALAGASSPLKDSDRAALVGKVDPPAGYRYDGGEVVFRGELGIQGANVSIEHYVNDSGSLLDVEHSDAGAAPIKGPAESVGHGHTAYLTLELGTSIVSLDASDGGVVTLRGDDPEMLLRVARTLR